MKFALRLALLFILTASPALANAQPAQEKAPTDSLGKITLIGALGLHIFAEQEDTESQFQPRFGPMLRLGAGLKQGDAFLEFDSFNFKEAEGNTSVERTQRLLLAWFRYRFEPVDGEIIPFIGAAVGLQNESVRETVASSSVKSSGKAYLAGGISTGVIWLVAKNLQLDGEVRVLGSQTFRPNPTIGATFSIGFRY